MKKLYLLTLTAAVALSAGAAPTSMIEGISMPAKELRHTKAETVADVSSIMMENSKGAMSVSAIRKADASTSITGSWQIDFWDLLWSDSTKEIYTVDYTCEAQGEYYVFQCDDVKFYPFILESGTAANTYDMKWVIFAETTDGDFVTQEPFWVNPETREAIDVQILTLDYDPATGVMSYREQWGLFWGVYDNTYELRGYIDGFVVSGMKKEGVGNGDGNGDDNGGNGDDNGDDNGGDNGDDNGDDSAVATVGAEELGAVRYFNLQGVEVANPENGSIVICRQGSKATKMIVR